MELTTNDFFCGCGGLGLGFKQAGFDIKGAWDFDKYAVQTYKENVGDHVLQANIMEMTWQDVPKASVWTFGFPCQDLSVAGAMEGMKVTCKSHGHEYIKTVGVICCPECGDKGYTAANRSGLFYEVMRLLEETTANNIDNLPAVIMAENVKGLKPYIPALEEEYKKQGYTAHITMFNSKYWGVPQNRERFFIVGTRDDLNLDFSFPVQQTEFVPKLSTILDKEVPDNFYIADEKAKAIIEQALKKLENLGTVHATLTPDRLERRQQGRRAKEEEEMFTVTAQDLHGVIESQPDIVTINPRKSDGTQTYQQDRVYSTAGSIPSVTSLLSGRTNIVEAVEAPHLKMLGMLDIKGNDVIRRVYDIEGISPTTTTTCEGGNRQVKVLEPTFMVPEATAVGVAVAKLGDSINISFPNSKTRRGRVGKEIAQTLITGCEQATICPTTYKVRKLTPTEYGRLQGFPMDTWKQVVSNSQAYKQFGNAVTVTVAKAIAEKIKELLEKL